MALVPSSTRKGLGLKFERGTLTTHGLETMGLKLHGIPESFSHEPHIPIVNGKRFVFDQQNTSTCVANTFMHAVILKEARDGLPFDQPSRLFPYWNSRKEHGGQWLDTGTYLRTLAIALRKFGTPSEKFWKWGQLGIRVNRRPNWTAMRKAHPRRAGKYVRIYEAGQDRTRAIQTAIMAGHDVGFGTRVSQSFLASTGKVLLGKPSPTDPIAGNHAMLIIGWQTFGGKLYFRILNSWGDQWRDGGLCWMSADYIEWTHTQDLHVIYGWERLAV